MKRKRIDFLITILLIVAGATISYLIKPVNPILALLYLGIPSFYLMLRERKNYKKVFWGVLILGVLMSVVFDFVATLNGAWAVSRMMFPHAVIGTWPIESAIGYIFMTLFVIIFYEHFLDDERDPRLSKSHSRAFLILLLVLVLVFTAYLLSPGSLQFSYFYLKAGFVAIMFPIIFAFYNPRIIKKFAPLAFFFFFVWLLVEIVGVSNQNWIFQSHGQFVGSATIFGITFPFEEIFFWFMWYPAVIVAYYEYFVDDRR